MGNKNLLKLMRHTAVNAYIDSGVFHGLGHHAQIDYVIGAVQKAVELFPFDRDLHRDYNTLRNDKDFKLYLTGNGDNKASKQKDPVREQKNQAYKALNGF